MMDIEELVQKYYSEWARQDMTMRQALEAALTELAAGYEKRLQDANLEIDRLRLVIDKCGESELVLCQGINEATVANLVEALRGVIRVADRDTVEFDAAKAAILNAVGE